MNNEPFCTFFPAWTRTLSRILFPIINTNHVIKYLKPPGNHDRACGLGEDCPFGIREFIMPSKEPRKDAQLCFLCHIKYLTLFHTRRTLNASAYSLWNAAHAYFRHACVYDDTGECMICVRCPLGDRCPGAVDCPLMNMAQFNVFDYPRQRCIPDKLIRIPAYSQHGFAHLDTSIKR
jgi:hypothetical protein